MSGDSSIKSCAWTSTQRRPPTHGTFSLWKVLFKLSETDVDTIHCWYIGHHTVNLVCLREEPWQNVINTWRAGNENRLEFHSTTETSCHIHHCWFHLSQCPLRCHKAFHVEHEYIHYTELIKTKGWQKAFKHVVESVEYALKASSTYLNRSGKH